MAVKVFGASLIFSYLFLCIMSYKNITEDEFDNFKGIEVTATCGCAKSMQDLCLRIDKSLGISHENEAFKAGFPKCVDKNIQLQKKGTQELVVKSVKMLVCSWPSNCNDDYYTKGQGPNHVMNFDCEPSTCLAYNDIKVK